MKRVQPRCVFTPVIGKLAVSLNDLIITRRLYKIGLMANALLQPPTVRKKILAIGRAMQFDFDVVKKRFDIGG